MAKYIADGNVINVSGGTAGITSGAVVALGKIVGVAPYTIAAGATGVIQVAGIFEMPKASATVIAAGAEVFFDPATGEVGITGSTATIACGNAVAAAGNGETSVQVRLR